MMTANTWPILWANGARALCDHLWQSTLFAIAVSLLVLLLRNNQARTRYWLWFAASAKFLIPFSLLAVMGVHFASITHVSHRPTTVAIAIQHIGQPLMDAAPLDTPIDLIAQPPKANHFRITPLAAVLTAIWLAGFLGVLITWLLQWRRLSLSMRIAEPLQHGRELEMLRRVECLLHLPRPIEMLDWQDAMEPGVFGMLRPVLLWPSGISGRLDDAQLEAILVHELSHIRWRDNLTSILPMVVAAAFWFYPPVWWMKRELIKEREMACDEEVVRICHRPQIYAESILKVCEFCIESPLPCVSGVTGADLKKRVVKIMTGKVGLNLSTSRKALLLVAGLAAMAIPIGFGLFGQVMTAPDWEKAAGGKMAFEVASVKENKLPLSRDNYPNTNFTLGSAPQYTPSGGRFSVKNQTLEDLIGFAYKLGGQQTRFMLRPALPVWAQKARFDIEARATPGLEPTKDQMRLMVQALLADRFKFTAHFEIKDSPEHALRLVQPGVLGPNLKFHPPDVPCKMTQDPYDPHAPRVPEPADGLPLVCGTIKVPPYGSPLEVNYYARGVAIAEIAKIATLWYDDGRAVVDETGLTGVYDMTFAFTPESSLAAAADANAAGHPVYADQHGAYGPALVLALKKQLGMKLENTRGPVQTFVLDHIEYPSEN